MAVSLDYTQIHEVFKPNVGIPYDAAFAKDMESKRKQIGGVLFIDRVLKALGITKGTILAS